MTHTKRDRPNEGEAFEKWWMKDTGLPRPDRDEEGRYCISTTRAKWAAWQASRSAVLQETIDLLITEKFPRAAEIIRSLAEKL